MPLALSVIRSVPLPYPDAWLGKVVRETLRRADAALAKLPVSLEVVSLSENEMKQVNRTYRGQRSATDILSFPAYASLTRIRRAEERPVFLGQLFVCYDWVKAGAAEDRVAVAHELSFVLSHGVLHLLGMRHSRRMFALQDAVSAPYRSPRLDGLPSRSLEEH